MTVNKIIQLAVSSAQQSQRTETEMLSRVDSLVAAIAQRVLQNLNNQTDTASSFARTGRGTSNATSGPTTTAASRPSTPSETSIDENTKESLNHQNRTTEYWDTHTQNFLYLTENQLKDLDNDPERKMPDWY